MANFVYNKAAYLMKNHGHAEALDLLNDSIRMMIVGSGYTADRDHDYVGSGAGTAGGEEFTGSGYTKGHLGAGRHIITGFAITEVDASDWVKVAGNNPADWDPFGGAINDNNAHLIVMRDGTTDDSDALLIAHFDSLTGGTYPFLSNGGKFTFTWHANGIMLEKTNP